MEVYEYLNFQKPSNLLVFFKIGPSLFESSSYTESIYSKK